MNSDFSVLIVDKHMAYGRWLGTCLAERGVNADFETVTTAEQVVAALHLVRWDIVLCRVPATSDDDAHAVHAWEVLSFIKAVNPKLPMIAVGEVDQRRAIELMQAGVRDVVSASAPDRLASAIKRELETRLVRSWLAEVAETVPA
jgi:DNA-binding NtrC family response regulator